VTVPDPLAASGRVVNDPGERTLIVRPAESGYAALLWRAGHRALVDAGEPDSLAAYMRNDAPAPWATGRGNVTSPAGFLPPTERCGLGFSAATPFTSGWFPHRGCVRLSRWIAGPAASWA
jgi:hypothetical protein